MSDINSSNVIGEKPAREPAPEALQGVQFDDVIDKASRYQSRMNQTSHAPQEGQVLIPSDEVLRGMVQDNLLKHMLEQSPDALSAVQVRGIDVPEVLNRNNVSSDEFGVQVDAGVSKVKEHFGVGGITGREVIDGGVLYNLNPAPEENLELSQLASPSMMARLRQGIAVGGVLQGLVDEGEKLAAQQVGVVARSQATTVRSLSTTPEIPGLKDLEKLGEGGMGTVYLCKHTDSDSPAVVKVLKTSYHKTQRFKFEGDVLEGLTKELSATEGLPRHYTSGVTEDGTSFVVQEFVPGVDLSKDNSDIAALRAAVNAASGSKKEEAQQNLEEKINERYTMLVSALETLQEVHNTGIIHRDLKPSNLMLVRNPESNAAERIVLVDFGIATVDSSLVQHEEGSAMEFLNTRDDFTPAGGLIGTPRYISPEQARMNQVTTKSDVFSMGIVLYESATGVHPLQSNQTAGQLNYIHAASQTDFHESHDRRVSENPTVAIDEELVILVSDALEKDPEKRPTAGEFATRLKQYLENKQGAE